MMDALLSFLATDALALRYRVTVEGLNQVVAKGTEKILLLPNHPALVDPLILAAHLLKDLHPIFLADSQQIDRPVLRWVAKRYGVRPLPDVKEFGAAARAEVERALTDMAGYLADGRNVVLYPSGHIYRSRDEDLRGNSAALRLIQAVPGLRVVLVRQTGLWGSSFGWASGSEPDVARALRAGVGGILASGVLFTPRRPVKIELFEPEDLPTGSRDELNGYLERFYNAEAQPNTYVPRSCWERGGIEVRPEPIHDVRQRDTVGVPAGVREIVLGHLSDLTGRRDFDDCQDLSRDLGLDSLARAELLTWIEQQFGHQVSSATSLETVADVLLTACGEAISHLPRRVEPPARKWSRVTSDRRITFRPDVATVTDAFLDVADRGLDRPLIADQNSGVRTVGDVVTGVFVLEELLAGLPGDYLGLMLPASVGATVSYLSALFARKTPVMVNWTVGERAIIHGLDSLGVEKVLTSKQLVARLEDRGMDFGAIADRCVFIEDLVANVGKGAKLRAWWRSRMDRGALRRIKVRDEAVVLFTSGSESLPKAVPLTHANVIANLKDAASVLTVRENDVVLGMLPPFHSFGLTVCIGLSLGGGVRVAYHPDPTDAGMLARLVETYRATWLIGTPTFVSGIVRAATREQLATVRRVVTGAEACPPRVYDAIRERCPQAAIIEGYGITECSPIVSINDENDPRPFTIGKPLPSVEHVIVDVDTGVPVMRGRRGLLLVRGPSIFRGYLHHEGAPPFVEHDGKLWYRTGDLVTEDEQGVLTFAGRLQRFVKLGGEMVSLPAVESVLAAHFPASEDQSGPTLAVVAGGNDERPELVLFVTQAADRAEVNDRIRAGGLSPLHHVRRVIEVESIPVLGTGKTDYRTLQSRLGERAG
jgi:acyl-CoA synthetase (AMP-forming)/AMP-acid ligase II/1-acyl-sn-glycerol-3-phosphate acyltransferase/acyl carrier protein